MPEDKTQKSSPIDGMTEEESQRWITKTMIELAYTAEEADEVVRDSLGITSLNAMIGDCEAIMRKKLAFINDLFPEIAIVDRIPIEDLDAAARLYDDYNVIIATIISRKWRA
jgi:hypothetical protein